MNKGDRFSLHIDWWGQIDGDIVRVWDVSSDGDVEVIPEAAWPKDEDSCPVGIAWIIPADEVADCLTPAPKTGSGT